MNPTRLLASLALGAAILATAGPVHAEQPATDTTAPFAVNARLNFRLTYPRFLRFRVGATGATVNLMSFTVPAGNVGSGTPVAPTGGDAGGGTGVNVLVYGNNGQVTITATNSSGGLGIGTATASDGRINYNQISSVSSSGQLPAPVLTNAGGTTALPTLNSTLVTQRTAVWTYSYLNQTIPSAGTYGGTNASRGGRVTYTATMP
ncbi:MAG: hypothetical protein IPL06_15445 [Betaproteobacteria bacterium]|nr:hypothetical protein [Betaproteobacteria bacterium]